MESNYEKQVIQARSLFLNFDQERMIEKFYLQADEAYLYLPFLDGRYRVSRSDGVIGKEEADGFAVCMDYETVMTIYDILCCSADRPVLAKEWCRLASLQITGGPSSGLVTEGFARKFSGQAERLRRACQALKGEKQSVPASADVCFQIPLFPFFPVIFQFWDGDEEFDPRLVLLWDRNALQFLHFETLYYATAKLLERVEYYFRQSI